jgi:hypothetical protein
VKIRGKFFEREDKRFVQIKTEEDLAECEIEDSRFCLQTHKSIVHNRHFSKLAFAFLVVVITAITAMLFTLKVSTY